MYDFDIDTYNVLCLFLPASSPTPTFPKKEDQSKEIWLEASVSFLPFGPGEWRIKSRGGFF